MRRSGSNAGVPRAAASDGAASDVAATPRYFVATSPPMSTSLAITSTPASAHAARVLAADAQNAPAAGTMSPAGKTPSAAHSRSVFNAPAPASSSSTYAPPTFLVSGGASGSSPMVVMAWSTRATPGTSVSRHRMMTRSSLSTTASPSTGLSAAICASAHGSQRAAAASAPRNALGSYRGTATGLVSARVLDAGARFSTCACARNVPMALHATRESSAALVTAASASEANAASSASPTTRRALGPPPGASGSVVPGTATVCARSASGMISLAPASMYLFRESTHARVVCAPAHRLLASCSYASSASCSAASSSAISASSSALLAFFASASSSSSAISPSASSFARASASACLQRRCVATGADAFRRRGMSRRITSRGLRAGASSSSPGTGKGSAGNHACTSTGAGGGGGGAGGVSSSAIAEVRGESGRDPRACLAPGRVNGPKMPNREASPPPVFVRDSTDATRESSFDRGAFFRVRPPSRLFSFVRSSLWAHTRRATLVLRVVPASIRSKRRIAHRRTRRPPSKRRRAESPTP